MSTHKSIDRVCCVVIAIAVLLSCAMVFAKAFGIEAKERVLGYETRLFDTERVHTIDIEMDDWDSFIASCENEEYSACTVVIDDESKKNVAIRAKGNTSLSNVRQLGSERYSFKLEFDHYEEGKTYHGLDKLSLNNLIQDNTMMKDYLCYQLMGKFGVSAPLCSFVYLTVNGEDWGLYLAVEGVEDAFLSRNYDGEGNLYKPDSMDMGGGRGNGREFEMDPDEIPQGGMGGPGGMDGNPGDMGGGMGGPGGWPQMPQDGEMPEMPQNGEMPEMPQDGHMPQMPQNGEMPQMPQGGPDMGGGPGGMGGSADVKLQYIDDDPDSYANIFDNAKTDISEADKKRLIASLKALSEKEDLEDILDTEEVLRYFVVHDFVCNGDSYTGSMIHNYYLYENDGRLGIIPWDYNLAFGGFRSFSASSTVNEPIDSPVSEGSVDDRPMAAWIFDGGEYQARYHELYDELISDFDFEDLVERTKELIAPYVEKDPSKFCTFEEFEVGADTLADFCRLRAESVRGQLDGTIPATSEAQSADSSALIDASSVTISDMGSMQAGMGGPGGPSGQPEGGNAQMPDGDTVPQMPDDSSAPQMQGSDPAPQMPQGGGFSPGGPGGGFPGQQRAGGNGRTWLLCGLCAFVLIFGLLIVKFYRRQ